MTDLPPEDPPERPVPDDPPDPPIDHHAPGLVGGAPPAAVGATA